MNILVATDDGPGFVAGEIVPVAWDHSDNYGVAGARPATACDVTVVADNVAVLGGPLQDVAAVDGAGSGHVRLGHLDWLRHRFCDGLGISDWGSQGGQGQEGCDENGDELHIRD